MIVGFAPGGGTDVTARVIVQPLSDGLGQRVVIDNRPGANGVLGTEIAAKSPPDGYTILMVNSGHTVNPGMYPKLPYDSIRDFAPISLVVMLSNLLVVHPSLPVKSVPEFVRLARALLVEPRHPAHHCLWRSAPQPADGHGGRTYAADDEARQSAGGLGEFAEVDNQSSLSRPGAGEGGGEGRGRSKSQPRSNTVPALRARA